MRCVPGLLEESEVTLVNTVHKMKHALVSGLLQIIFEI